MREGTLLLFVAASAKITLAVVKDELPMWAAVANGERPVTDIKESFDKQGYTACLDWPSVTFYKVSEQRFTSGVCPSFRRTVRL